MVFERRLAAAESSERSIMVAAAAEQQELQVALIRQVLEVAMTTEAAALSERRRVRDARLKSLMAMARCT